VKQESETKIKLLETAAELIWESSYGSVSVDDICARAGVNKGSFYYAFPSKADLTVAAFERMWQSKQPVFDQIFSPQIPPLQRVEKYCDSIIDLQKKKHASMGKMCGCPFSSIGSELSTQEEKIRLKVEEIGHRYLRYLESMVRDLVAAGLSETTDPAETAREIYSYGVGVCMQAKIENDPGALDRLKPGIFRILSLKTEHVTA
jgi:TetR/AcrR family transcriptional regulator, transcriptional repressor for nem operon